MVATKNFIKLVYIKMKLIFLTFQVQSAHELALNKKFKGLQLDVRKEGVII